MPTLAHDVPVTACPRHLPRLQMLVLLILPWVLCQRVEASASRPLSREDLDELTSRIFPLRARDGFVEKDLWTSLSVMEREAWAAANSFVGKANPFDDAQTLLLQRHPILVPIHVYIVDPDNLAPAPPSLGLDELGRAMRAGFAETAQDGKVSKSGVGVGGIQARFSIERTSSMDADRLTSAAKTSQDSLRQAMEDVLGENIHGLNILFVLVGFNADSLAVDEDAVQVGSREKLAWVVPHKTSNFLRVLNVAEEAARLYIPAPAYYPIPGMRQFRIDVHPFTPQHQQRALWYADFDWGSFEADVRALSVPGQILGFFASQTTEECGKLCKDAFGNLDSVLRTRAVRAATILNGLQAPNASWASTEAERAPNDDDAGPIPEFDIYVVDSARVSGSASAPNFDTSPPITFPGMAILFTRSSKDGAADRIRRFLVASCASGVYGVAEPLKYLAFPQSRILTEVIARNFVASLLSVHARAALDLLENISRAGIRPSKALSDREHRDLVQRLNLLLAKQDKARAALRRSNDIPSAVHYAFSALYDVRAMRRAFGLSIHGDPPTSAGFRDPTVRCHFSRVKRGALMAGELLRRTSLEWGRVILGLSVYLCSLLLSRGLAARQAKQRSLHKRR